MSNRTLRWERAGYSEIAEARIRNDDLEVTFQNGDRVRIPLSSLGLDVPASADVTVEDGLSVKVSHAEVSWLTIRSLSDTEFASHVRDLGTEDDQLLGRRLRALREDREMTRGDLARAAGISVSRLAKVEKGEENADSAMIRRLLKEMQASWRDIADPGALDVSVRTVIGRAHDAGVPRDLGIKLAQAVSRNAVPEFLARAFAWSKDELLKGVPTTRSLAGAVQFKTISKQAPTGSPMVHLAYEVARLAHAAFDVPPYTQIPSSPADIRREVLERSREISLESLLEWTWSKGIPVLPLAGQGVFAAAVFALQNGPAIVIKDARDLTPIWLFDLAHELGHVAQSHVETALVDVESPAIRTGTDAQEKAATVFALDLLMPDHETLLDRVQADAMSARQPGVRFKFAVEAAAKAGKVSPALLGVIAAFSLSQIGRPADRWGSATNLAKPQGSGPDDTRRLAMQRARLDAVTSLEATLLQITVLDTWKRSPDR